MIRDIFSIATAVFVLAFSGSVFAQEYYYGGNLAFVDYSVDGAPGDVSLSSIYGRLGTDFTENFSGEVRAGLGIGDDSIGVLGSSIDIELDNFIGAYVRGGIPVSETIFPYVLIGYTRAETSVSGLGFSGSGSENDVSFGIGSDIQVNNFTLNIEYLSYFDKDGVELSGFAIGLVGRF